MDERRILGKKLSSSMSCPNLALNDWRNFGRSLCNNLLLQSLFVGSFFDPYSSLLSVSVFTNLMDSLNQKLRWNWEILCSSAEMQAAPCLPKDHYSFP